MVLRPVLDVDRRARSRRAGCRRSTRVWRRRRRKPRVSERQQLTADSCQGAREPSTLLSGLRDSREDMSEADSEERVLLGRPDGDANRLRRAEARERPDDHALAQQPVEERRAAADVGEEEVPQRRAGRLEAVASERSPSSSRPAAFSARRRASSASSPMLASAAAWAVASRRTRAAPCSSPSPRPSARCRSRRAGPRARRSSRTSAGRRRAGLLEQLDAVGVVGIVDVLEVRLVDDREDVLGQALDEREQLVAAVRRPGRVVRMADVHELRLRPDRSEHRVEVVDVVAQRHLARHRRRASARRARSSETTASRRRSRRRVERRLREQVDHPVGAGADDHFLEARPRGARRAPSAARRRPRRGTGSGRAPPARAPRPRPETAGTGPRSRRA